MEIKYGIKRLKIRKKQVSTSFDEDTHQEFKAYCKRMKTPMSRVLQALVEEFLKNEPI